MGGLLLPRPITSDSIGNVARFTLAFLVASLVSFDLSVLTVSLPGQVNMIAPNGVFRVPISCLRVCSRGDDAIYVLFEQIGSCVK